MSEIVLRGSLDEVQLQLVWIHQAVLHRKTGGWPLFQADEDWIYETAGDERVCPYCRGFEEDNPWQGNEIPHFFPHYYLEGSHAGGTWGSDVIVRPNVHENQELTFLMGTCRCKIRLLNAAATLEARLHKEKLEALVVK